MSSLTIVITSYPSTRNILFSMNVYVNSFGVSNESTVFNSNAMKLKLKVLTELTSLVRKSAHRAFISLYKLSFMS